MTKGVPSFSEQEKESALAIIRQNPSATVSELERKVPNISGTTLARWRKEIQDGTGNMGQEKSHSNDDTGSDSGEQPRQRVTERQRLQALEEQAADYLRTIRVQNIVLAYLRRYASATEGDRKDIEIEYLIALLAEYGCEEPERLSMQEPGEGE